MSEYCSQFPSTYARNKLSTMLSRWNGPIGEAVRRLSSSRDPMLFPGMPPTMALAFSANSTGMTENVPATETKRFIEIGLYNLPGSSGTAQYDSPQPNSQYGRLAVDARTRALIGRSAYLSSEWRADYDGQVAVGLLGYRDDGINNVESRLNALIRPRERGSSWDAACAIAGYVMSTGFVTAANRHANELAAVPEAQRAAALFALVAADFERTYARGQVPDAAERRVFLRVVQRIEVGRALQIATGGSTAWWPDYGSARDAIFHWLTLALRGEPGADCQAPANRSLGRLEPGQFAGSVAGSSSVVLALQIALIVIAALTSFWVYEKWRTRRA
jgi:hypothetical protein